MSSAPFILLHGTCHVTAPHQRGVLVTTDESTLTYHDQPKSTFAPQTIPEMAATQEYFASFDFVTFLQTLFCP